jgi:hypothetical protein
MDSVVFYQPQLATVPNFNGKLVRPLATTRNNAGSALLQNSKRNPSWRVVAEDYCDGSSDDDEFPPPSELWSKWRRDSAAVKLNPESMTESTVDDTPDGNPASSCESRAGGSQG